MPQDDPYCMSRLISQQDNAQIFEIAKQIMLDTMQSQQAVDTSLSCKEQIPSLQSFKYSQEDDFTLMARTMHDNLHSQKSSDLLAPLEGLEADFNEERNCTKRLSTLSNKMNAND